MTTLEIIYIVVMGLGLLCPVVAFIKHIVIDSIKDAIKEYRFKKF